MRSSARYYGWLSFVSTLVFCCNGTLGEHCSFSISFSSTVERISSPYVSIGFEEYENSTAEKICGRRFIHRKTRIVATGAEFGEWPWMISLGVKNQSPYAGHRCGATLLNNNWAVTTANCVKNISKADIRLMLGDYHLSLNQDYSEDADRRQEPCNQENRGVSEVVVHPSYKSENGVAYDLALLKFSEPIKFQPNIVPICLSEDDSDFFGKNATATGWGEIYKDGPPSKSLQEVTLPVIKNSICKRWLSKVKESIGRPNKMLCAGYKTGGAGICSKGDYGGPLMIQNSDKRWVLIGVASWSKECGASFPSVFTRISRFKEFFDEHVNID